MICPRWGSDPYGQAQEFAAFCGRETRQHEAAVVDMGAAKARGETATMRGELDADDAPVVGNAAANDQALALEAIERRGDGGERGGERLRDVAHGPGPGFGEDLEKSDVVGVEAGVDAACQQAGFDAKLAHEGGDACVQRECVLCRDGRTG